ncbi:RIO kinase 1 [Promicromonospora umidemergens]|uniref:non-specific serine/threonine protein kinase n=1 Tax=Promicromonospora umidemergens TaxID=629679 RepID=A0ABP8XUV7_9MICO|nr:RIO1 family regulatory kinase/ATPase [Promicromonospora umidemergens]MCP2286062.1 RIO kinase 1 [Promicromonospora umidemergens]
MPRFPEAPKSALIRTANRGGKPDVRSAPERAPKAWADARRARVSRDDLEGPHPSTLRAGPTGADGGRGDAYDAGPARPDPTQPDPTQPGPGQRWSTWRSVAKGQRGPDPQPDWLVTRDAALDTELGILKTGKEADAFLVERAVPLGAETGDVVEAERCLLVAKRYRSLDHGQFHRGTEYTEGRQVRRTRDQRAMEDRKSAWGRAVSATQWADAEFVALRELWSAGAPVPYPVQIDGTEVLMEFVGTEVTDDAGRTQAVAAPRLTRERPSDDLLESYWEQLTHGMTVLARLGFAHGDLSPYNILADGERLVIIDLPQVVDLASNPFASDVLLRDCRTVCTWFAARGLEVDADALFADLLAQAF